MFLASRAEWRQWLASHGGEKGIWAVTLKGSPDAPTYNDLVEEALCFGWVDSKPRSLDASRKMLWFAPRKPRSGWSRINKERVARLTELGLMAEPGLRRVAESEADGSWHKLDEVEDLLVPDDLARAFADRPPAHENFEAFPRSVKRGILEWIVQAKKPETRAARIAQTAELAQQNMRANQWKRT